MTFDPTPPPSGGIRWFFTVFFRALPGLAALNLVFLLSCLPVVTLGPALSALGWVLGQVAGDQPVEPVRDYLSAFRAGFLRKLGWGMGFLSAALILGVSAWFYGSLGLLPLTGLSLAGLFCLCGLALHLLPALSDPAPPSRPLSAAVAAALSSFRQTVLALLSALAFLLPQALLFPALLPSPLWRAWFCPVWLSPSRACPGKRIWGLTRQPKYAKLFAWNRPAKGLFQKPESAQTMETGHRFSIAAG